MGSPRLDPLSHFERRLQRMKSLTPEDKRHVLHIIERYRKDAHLSLEQQIMKVHGLHSYAVNLSLMDVMDKQPVSSGAFKQATWNYSKHADNVKRSLTGKTISDQAKRDLKGPRKNGAASALWQGSKPSVHAQPADAVTATEQE